MSQFDLLLYRIQKLPLNQQELGLDDELSWLSASAEDGGLDRSLYDMVDSKITMFEEFLKMCPYLPPTASLAEGSIKLGRTACDEPACLNIGCGFGDVQHGFVAGAVASGKSCAVASIALKASSSLDVVVIDSQNTFGKIPRMRSSFEFVNSRDCRIAPMNLLPELDARERLSLIMKAFAEAYTMQFGKDEALKAAFELPGEKLNVRSLRDHLVRKLYGPQWNKARYRDTAVHGFDAALDGLYPMLECQDGMNLLTILTRGRVVFRVDSHTTEHQAFLIMLIFVFCFMLRRAGRSLSKPLLLVIDEAQLILKNVGVVEQILTIRHSNVHLLLCAQQPSLLPSEVMNNMEAFLIFSLMDSQDRDRVGKTINLTRKQQDFIAALPKRQAVCCLPRAKFRRPFLLNLEHVEVDPQPVDMPTAAFVKNLPWTPIEGGEASDAGHGRCVGRAKQASKERTGVDDADSVAEKDAGSAAVDELDQKALHVLIEVARHPAESMLQHYSRAELHPSQGTRAVQRLVGRKMIRVICLVRVGSGARPRVAYLLKPGLDELSKRGIEPVAKAVGRGGPEHDVYARIIGSLEQSRGSKVSYEQWFGNKSFDVLGDKDGSITGYEVVLSGSAGLNAQQAIKAASVAGVDHVVMACKDTELMRQIEKRLYELDAEGIYRNKVSVTFLGEYVTRVFERAGSQNGLFD